MENKKSMLEVATEIISASAKAVKFGKLWGEVCAQLSIPEDQANKNISLFYTQLTTSGTLVQEKDNSWNLASRVSYDKSHLNIEDTDEESESIEMDEGEEEAMGLKENSVSEENIDGQTDEEEKKEEAQKLTDIGI